MFTNQSNFTMIHQILTVIVVEQPFCFTLSKVARQGWIANSGDAVSFC